MYTITYHKKVVKNDIPKLDTKARNSIKKAIETKLIETPEKYTEGLRNTLSGNRKLRVGNYRVVFKIMRKEVKILIIAHRSKVYEIVRE